MEATEHELWRSSVKAGDFLLHNDGTLQNRYSIDSGYSTVLLRLWIIGTLAFVMAMPLTCSVKDSRLCNHHNRTRHSAVYCNNGSNDITLLAQRRK